MLLGFQRLVQPLRIPPALHHAAGELVDDDDLVLPHDVVDIARKQRVRAQRLLHVMHDGDVEDVVEIAFGDDPGGAQHVLDALRAGLGQGNGLELLVLVVGLGILHQLLHHRVHLPVKVGTVLGGAGDDERRARLVDQDAVDLVDDAVGEVALDHVLQAILHVVAKVVEAELVVGAVGDVGGVGGPALPVVEPVHDDADRHAEEAVDLAHPLRVAPREVVVDGDDVNTVSRQRVEINRQGRDQRLALTGFHLGDLALVEHHAADQLHVEMPLAQRALAGLAHHGEGFGQQLVQGRTVGEARPELHGLGPECLVAERCHRRLQRIDLRHPPLICFERPVVGGAEQGAGNAGEHEILPERTARRLPRLGGVGLR